SVVVCSSFFLSNTGSTVIYTLSLHDALPICLPCFTETVLRWHEDTCVEPCGKTLIQNALMPRSARRRKLPLPGRTVPWSLQQTRDRKSTRLNSSHSQISYAVFCLKKKRAADRFDRRHAPAVPRPRRRGHGHPAARREELRLPHDHLDGRGPRRGRLVQRLGPRRGR